MRVIYAGVPQEVPDSYALRLIEQGKAIPAPISPRAESKPKAKAPKDVSAHVSKRQDRS